MQYPRQRVATLSMGNSDADDMFFRTEIDPSGSIRGVAYEDAFIKTRWEEQEEQLAWLLLNNLFAIFEAWAQRIFEERFGPKGCDNEKVFIQKFQFPGLSTSFSTYYARGSNKSDVMENAFYGMQRNGKQRCIVFHCVVYAKNPECFRIRDFFCSKTVLEEPLSYRSYFNVSTKFAWLGPSTKGLYTETVSPLVLTYQQVWVWAARSTLTAKPT